MRGGPYLDGAFGVALSEVFEALLEVELAERRHHLRADPIIQGWG